MEALVPSEDAGPVGGGPADSGAPDSGAPDSGTPDSGTPDAGETCGPCLRQACLASCGNGVCESWETCGNCATDCGVCRPICDGTPGAPGAWEGCRGNGCAVCAEKLTAFPNYVRNHPSCYSNVTCAGQFFLCNVCCPVPTDADR